VVLVLTRLSGAIAILVVAAGCARAGAFDDFNQGISAHNRGDNETAVAAFNRALASGDLVPSLRSVALYDRGLAYRDLKQYQQAIADLSAVIAEKPQYFDALQYRAGSNENMGNFEAALPDCKTMAALMPKAPSLLGWCGRIAYKAGKYDQAITYLDQALSLPDGDPKLEYDTLWLKLADLRRGRSADPQFAATARHAAWGWPGPIVQFFLGRKTEADVKSAAETGDAKTRQSQECEAGFYIGEWDLAYQNRNAAKPLLVQAASLCPNDFIELQPAKLDLERLEQGAP
jgi:lipoprotein NlpI